MRDEACAAVLGDRRQRHRRGHRCFIHIGHSHRNVLGIDIYTVADFHLHVIDIVTAHIGGDLVVRSVEERKHARGCVDREFAHIRAADDAINQCGTSIDVECSNCCDSRCIFGDGNCSAWAGTIGGDVWCVRINSHAIDHDH